MNKHYLVSLMDVLHDIKMQVWRWQKKLKSLAEELSISYSQLIRIVNGFSSIPVDFYKRVTKVLERWDSYEKRL